MTRALIYILLTIIITAIAIASLYLVTNRITANGFQRKMKDIGVKHIATTDLQSKYIVFAGNSNSPLVFKDLEKPGVIYKLEKQNGQLNKVPLKLPVDFNLTSGYINTGVVEGRSYVTNGLTGAIMIFNGKKKGIQYRVPGLNFDQSIAISDHSVIVRTKVTQPTRYRELTKLSFMGNRVIKRSIRLPRQVDGIFCTDGWLQYDATKAQLIYTYYYRGQFLALDTNLKILYTAKTIDTVETANIRLAVVSSRLNDSAYVEQRTQVTPPPTINRHHTSHGDRIYVLSTLKADNESLSAFRENQVIDVYSSVDGKYEYSFYIPKYLGNKLRQFRIGNNRISCIFKTYLVEFSLSAL